MNIILIDSGTTNSRIRLTTLEDNIILDSLKLKIGVRNTAIEGSNKTLKDGLKEGILEILKKNNLKTKDISYIVASGMITSNLGLYELLHIESPASIEDFIHNSIVYKDEDFLDIPFLFIPGMKNKITDKTDILNNINSYDMMRGEEVETIGLLEQIEVSGKGIMILPGSHNKYIFIDEDEKMVLSMSTLSGEILSAIRDGTILSKSLNKGLITSLKEDILEKGYYASEEFGLTRTLYQVRLLDMFSELDENELANYYTGTIIHDDIKILLKSIEKEKFSVEWVIIGGSDPLKSIFYHLIKGLEFNWNIIKASDREVEHSTVIGSKSIANGFINK